MDTPDPYILLRLKTSPEGRRRTETKDNEVNPVWNEEFTFLIDERENNILRKFYFNNGSVLRFLCYHGKKILHKVATKDNTGM